MDNLPWLTLLMVVPLVGALVVAVLPSRSALLARPIALGVALLTLVIGIAATATSFTRGSSEQFQMVEQHEWIPQLGVSYSLGVDGISLVMIALIVAIWPRGDDPSPMSSAPPSSSVPRPSRIPPSGDPPPAPTAI